MRFRGAPWQCAARVETPEADLDQTLLAELAEFGDRTSAFVTAGAGFETFRPGDRGCVRYQRAGRWWLGATEPVAPSEHRVALSIAFAEMAGESGSKAALLPVSAELSAGLTARGWHRLQVGAEPIFDLQEVFCGPDPLILHARARALARKGATFAEWPQTDLAPGSDRRAALEEIQLSWQSARRSPPLGFLSRSAPFELREHRRYFVLEHEGRVEAFLAALPVPARNAWYFADLVRRPTARAGTMELLILEAMRLLWREGTLEVRLGLAPLADLDPRQTRTLPGQVLAWASRRSLLYDFQGNARFKRKLQPTSWVPLYVVTPRPPTLGLLRAIAAAHLPGGLGQALSVGLLQGPVNTMLRPEIGLRPWPASSAELARRTSLTVVFVVLCTVLHLLRMQVHAAAELHRATAFAPAAPTVSGLFLGPLWHNHTYHLIGDLSSFLLFGALLEILTGPRLFAVATAAGLWLSNPLTMLLAGPPLAAFSPDGYANLMRQIDYGSSNAIYAFVGVLAACVKRPAWLLLPFLLNGIWVCLALNSLLALHHLVALFGGYLAMRAWTARAIRKAAPPADGGT